MPDFERKYLKTLYLVPCIQVYTAVIWPIFIAVVSTFYNHIGWLWAVGPLIYQL